MRQYRAEGRLARWLPELAAVVGLILFPFVFPLVGGTFDMMDRILIWGLFGLGFDILFGFAGLLSFGQAAFFGTGGMVAAYLLTTTGLSNVVLALLIGLVAAAASGYLVVLIALRRPSVYLTMLPAAA